MMSEELDIHVHVCMYSPESKSTVEKSVVLHEHEDVCWTDVVNRLESQLTLSEKTGWAFLYFNEDEEMIFGKTEAEWKEAMKMGCAKQANRNTLHVSAFPMKSSGDQYQQQPERQQPCKQPDRQQPCKQPDQQQPCKQPDQQQPCKQPDQPQPCKQPELQQELQQQWNKSRSSCCANTCGEFCRPIPDPPPLLDTIPNKVVNMRQSEYKYSNEALRAVTLPLGALGGGNIALAGDGGLRQWQLSNEVNHTGLAPDSFFAVRVDQDGSSKAVALQSNTWYDQKGFTPAAYISDHVVPEASKQLLSDIPGVSSLEITAKYPIAEVDYLSDEVPVKVHLEAFSPTIPLDSKNSALPVVIFNFTVTNTGSKDAKVSLLGSLQNIAGWDGLSDITSEVHNAGYGGNINSLFQNSVMYGIDMSNPSLTEMKNSNGHVAITVMTKDGDKLSTELQYSSVKELWEHFTKDAAVGQSQVGPSPAGTTWNGALWCTRTLKPSATETFTFILAWHFPHRYVDWKQPGLEYSNPNSAFFIGNQYSNFWKDIREVLIYTGTNFDHLTSMTRSFRDSMFESTLPWQLIDSAAGRISVLKTPTCMWHADGNFYAYEGCDPKKGCCPLNCTHVWNYEMALAKLYPDVERTMRDVDLNEQITPHGVIPSRTIVPLVLRRIWSYWDDYSTNPASTTICVDGDIGTILKMYREVKQGAPLDWFDKLWPKVKKIMARWMTELDNGQGVISGPQPNTYDCSIYGINVYIGGYYLAALRAAEEMAKLQGDTDLAAKYHERFLSGSEQLDTLCYNGKWYTQVIDPKNPVNEVADGTWVDCLVGQWWAHSLGLGYILKEENIKSTLQNVFLKNHVDSFNPATQKPRAFFDQRDSGMTICVFPDKVPEHPLVYYSEGAWSGLEYEFAGLCMYEGLNEIALKVLTDTRNKYDGTRRSPWNEIECGDHYARPMSSFLLFEAASGQDWSFDKKDSSFVKLRFAPRICPTDFRGFFVLGSCWGQYVQKGDSDDLTNGTVQIAVCYGELRLSELSIASRAAIVTARCENDKNVEKVDVQVSEKNGWLIVNMSQTIIKQGSTITLELSG